MEVKIIVDSRDKTISALVDGVRTPMRSLSDIHYYIERGYNVKGVIKLR